MELAIVTSCALLLATAIPVGCLPKEHHSSELRLNLPDEFGTETEMQRRPDGAALVGSLSMITFFGKMVAKILLGGTMDIKCTILAFRNLFDTVMNLLPENIITTAVKDTLRVQADKCENKTALAANTKLALVLKMVANGFIFPGTKWCGPGNKARNDTDIGRAQGTDRCCQAHDRLLKRIPAFGTLYGVRNTFPYDLNSCDDDRKLYNCLLNVSSKTALQYGQLYFDVMQTRCFAYTFPAQCVNLKRGFLKSKCLEYELDITEPKEYQLFKPANFFWVYVQKWGIDPKRKRLEGPVDPPKSWKLIDRFDKEKKAREDQSWRERI